MKIEEGKIIEATENELFDYYLTRGWDDVLPFPDFLERMKETGVEVTK